MRIFLAGASGVIGQQLVPRLVQLGHVVGGVTRSPSKTELLSRLGAEPIVCNVFDREALIQAVRNFKPDVVLNELTDLPDDAAQIRELAALNARIRTEGTRTLIEAARRSGSPKILAQSVAWNCLTGPMPGLSQNWSIRFSPRAALCCAMDGSTGRALITSGNRPMNLEFTSTELPNERWRRWASQRASSSLSTERATALRRPSIPEAAKHANQPPHRPEAASGTQWHQRPAEQTHVPKHLAVLARIVGKAPAAREEPSSSYPRVVHHLCAFLTRRHTS